MDSIHVKASLQGLCHRVENACTIVLLELQGIGVVYARHLLEGGCNSLVLMSRSGILLLVDLAELMELGVVVYSIECNSADASQSASVMEWVHETLGCVQQYVHAAGLSSFALLGDMENSQFNHICGPKVRVSELSFHKLSI